MHTPSWQAFRPDATAVFVSRPNRFVAVVDLDGALVEAHCPNPGRLTELLFPGAKVILERADRPRKLAYTLVAVEHPGSDGGLVPLVSVRSNAAVEALVLGQLFPGAVVRPEFALGSSRFDFLVEDERRHLVEVKACSEVEFGSALFPDAPSDRARRHLEELAHWGDHGYVPHVVFAVTHGRPGFWAPNLHTDPDFARTLVRLAPRLTLHAVVFATGADGTTRLVNEALPLTLPDLGPDAGHLVTVERGPGGWSVSVEWYVEGFERAVGRAPARASFPVRGPEESGPALRAALGPSFRADDPRADRSFVATLMTWRHQTMVAPESPGKSTSIH